MTAGALPLLQLVGILVPEEASALGAELRTLADEDPAEAILWASLVAATLFYRAERGTNPKVNSLEDALVFVTTNLSVGYCDIFAQTPRGKQIASLLMIYGPALAAKALDKPAAVRRAEEAEEAARHEALVTRLDRIAELLAEAKRP